MSQDEQTFSAAERALLSRAAWTRVYARGGLPEAKFTEELFALNPEMKAIADKTAADYPKAKPDQIRLLTILRTPRYNILRQRSGRLGTALDDRSWCRRRHRFLRPQ